MNNDSLQSSSCRSILDDIYESYKVCLKVFNEYYHIIAEMRLKKFMLLH